MTERRVRIEGSSHCTYTFCLRVLPIHTTAILFELYTGFTASAFIVLDFLAQNQTCGKQQHY